MKLPRLSLSKVIAWIAILAVNFAVARILISESNFLVYRLSLLALCLEIGAYRLSPSRGRISWFWYGFVVSGLLALSSSVWASSYGNRPPKDSPFSRLNWYAWDGYLKLASAVLWRLPYRIQLFFVPSRGLPHLLQAALSTVVLFLPQFVFAVAGGLIARKLAAWSRPASPDTMTP